MKLKKIILENIRSYEHQEINFLEGSTLLSGDIGSGKTSVLLAIEFALFGLQPGQRGSALLRNGKKEGSVKIEFDVDGSEIVIERTLKKGKTISQDYCAISVDGERKELSVTELKNRVLDILSYPSEFAKKQNILYKFTVYTPQEEMKQIILEEPETRLNTLRHIFGVDKYKKVLENVSTVAGKLREEKRLKEGMTANLDQIKFNLLSKENDLEAKQSNVSSIEKELFLKTEKRKKIQEEKEEISKKIEQKNRFQSELEKTRLMILNKEDAISTNTKTISSLRSQIKELQEFIFDESLITKLEQTVLMNKREKDKFNQKNLEINSRINSLIMKNEEIKRLDRQLSNLDVDSCPTCLQKVSPVYRANVLNQHHSELAQANKEIEKLQEERISVEQKLRKIEEEISMAETKIRDLKILKMKLQDLKEKQDRISELDKLNFSLEKDINLLKEHVDLLASSILEYGKFENLFELKQAELDMALREERIADIKVAELKKEIEVFSNQIEELREEIVKTEKIKKQLNYITELENWLSKQFISLISFIEKNVMIKLKAEFSKLFAEWFYALVSDTFNVKLSDDFTPIVENQDYEIDYAYLSGGERTAIALAYRLALNQVINSLMSKIKTRDLVILDEPTDGFSEQQLDKMRDVLQQLNVKQLIIVSHEQKIEGFVENVIRFKKGGGITRVESSE